MDSRFRSWGGQTASDSIALSPDSWRAGSGLVLPFGNGRSYGDSCLNSGGGMISARQSARILSFDAETGVIAAEAGLLLSELIAHCLSAGWFVPVTPGTRFVTLGGCIANDVHGKNHHRAGTFGAHVLWFTLARSDGKTLRCSPDENAALFAATIGGMGLTGFIETAAIQLMKVPSALFDAEDIPFDSLDAFFRLARDSDAGHEYSVAWIDSLARGASLGRGIYFRGNHARAGGFEAAERSARLAVPFTPPFSAINRLTLAGFNAAYRFAHRKKRRTLAGYGPFFYPLDGVRGWNRLYGPRGLRQFQCVVPMFNARHIIAALIEETHRAGAASFLTVLKLFGDRTSPGMLSFPMPGATLTLDFPYQGERSDALLARLDAITLGAGGRVNPYKDARMSAETFRASFPQMDAFLPHVDPRFSSDFWRRVSTGAG